MIVSHYKIIRDKKNRCFHVNVYGTNNNLLCEEEDFPSYVAAKTWADETMRLNNKNQQIVTSDRRFGWENIAKLDFEE